MPSAKFSPFDVANHLKTEEDVVAFPAAESGDAVEFASALGTAVRARNVKTKKALAMGGNPSLETVMRTLEFLGLQLTARPISKRKSAGRRRAAGRPKYTLAQLIKETQRRKPQIIAAPENAAPVGREGI